nr:hypothetical protein [Tanacetum cinerariifolium]
MSQSRLHDKSEPTTQQYGAILPIELTTDEIRNNKAYKEYYACAMGEAAPKPKASARKKKDEGTGSKPGVLDVPSDDSEEEISWNSFDDEDVGGHEEGNKSDEGEKTAESDADDDNEESGEGDDEETESDGESVESIFTTVSSPIAPLPTTTHIMTPSTIATITTSSDAPIPPTTIPSTVLENLPTFDSVFRFEDRVKSLEVNFSEFMQTNQFADAVSKIPADLTETKLKKILIEKMEGNKSIQRSDEQRNLYKALVNAYEADKTILESYGDTAILKRRRGDDDDQEGPSAGSDLGSKRRRECGEHESVSTLSEPATRSASRSITGTQSRQMLASESAFAEEPVQTTCQMDEPPHPVFETGAEDQPIVQTSHHPEWFSQPRKPPTPDRDWNKTLPAIQGSAQTWISDLAKQADS